MTYIIILNYNNPIDTINCIRSLRELNYENYRIIVIDNGSNDNSINRIKSVFNDMIIAYYDGSAAEATDIDELEHKFNGILGSAGLIIIDNQENLGYSKGNNIGTKLAIKNNVDFVWILNNDTEVDRNSLKAMIQYCEQNPNIGICGGSILYFYDRDRVQCLSGAKYNILLGKSKSCYLGLNKSEINKIHKLDMDYVYGASLFIPIDVIKNVGLLSEDFFLYCEEIDFSIRCKKNKYELGWCKDAIIYHKEGASIGSSKKLADKSVTSEYYGNISALILTKKYYPRLFPLVFFVRFIVKANRYIFGRRFHLLKVLIKSYYDWIKGNK